MIATSAGLATGVSAGSSALRKLSRKRAANDPKIATTDSSSGPLLRANWKTLTPNRTKKPSCSPIVIGSTLDHQPPLKPAAMMSNLPGRGITGTLQLPRSGATVTRGTAEVARRHRGTSLDARLGERGL